MTCLALAILSLPIPAGAMLTVESAEASATNPTAFLLEAETLDPDPAANREAVQTALTVGLFNPDNFADDAIEIEATFSLVNEATGLPVDLQLGGTTLVATGILTLGPLARQNFQLTAALHPAARLDPSINHRVLATARYRPPEGVWSAPVDQFGAWRKWIHFTNTTADDDSLNVVTMAAVPALNDRQILQSLPGEEVFRASILTTAHRYDLESVPQTAAPVPVIYHLRLFEKISLVEIPLENPSLTVHRPMSARSAAMPPDPVTDQWEQTLEFRPSAGAIIDPMAEYVLEVAVAQEEPDTSVIPASPPIQTADAARFLVLSGRLFFGDVETTFSQLANDPLPPMALNAGVYSTQLGVLEGAASGAPGRRYGTGALLDVNYNPATGDATVTAGTQALETPGSDVLTLGGLRFVRGPMRLEPDGVMLESSGVFLPVGFGVSTAQTSLRHQPALNLPELPLNPDFSLRFTTREFSPPSGQYFYVVCDRLPLRFRTSAITWEVATGAFTFEQVPTADPADPAGPVLTRQFRDEELAALTPLLADPDAANRPSNDQILENITDQSAITIATGPLGEALLSVEFTLGPGQMKTHFPRDVVVSWAHGRFNVTQNQISDPGYIEINNPITLSYKRDCDGDCGSNAGPGQMIFTPADNKLLITPDGGLRADGAITPERLRWGTTELKSGITLPEGGLPFAHQTSQWSTGAFHAPGFHLAATATSLAAEDRPQGLLLSGVMADGSYERPLTAGYSAGLSDYAGLNLRVESPGGKSGRSVLAGLPTPDYDLKGRAKYYLRPGGVTGIHEAAGLVPGNLVMYGFPVNLDGFRLAFRDGLNVESKTGGSIHVDSPVEPNPGFDLDFKELSFKCRGQPNKMQLATEGETKSMAYWGTDFTPLSMEFANPVTATGCTSVDDGFLMVGVRTVFPSVTPQKLHATLGFMANGNLVTKANPLSQGLDFDSRFTLPPTIQVVGAGGIPWEVTVTGRAYLNNPSPGGYGAPPSPVPPGFQRPGNGFLVFPASINAPWFEDIKVQFHVSASSAANPASTRMHVMGGWPSNPADGNGNGWNISGQNYFTHKFFDEDHLGFPAGMDVDAYRDPATAGFNPRAQKRWLGVVDFDFNLQWDGTLRTFQSLSQQDDLLVLGNVHRQVEALSPSTAEITFGLSLDIPRVNTQALGAVIKEGISGGLADALTDALGTTLKDALGAGLIGMDTLLGERVNDLWRPAINAAADPLADAVLAGSPASGEFATLQNELRNLPVHGLDSGVDGLLEDGIAAIDSAVAIVGTGGNRTMIGNLVREMLERSDNPAVAGIVGTAVDEAVAEALPEIDPDLERSGEVLLRSKSSLELARTRIASQLLAIFQESATTSALDTAAARAVADIDALANSHEWTLLDASARRNRIRGLVSDHVMGCAAVPKFQYIVRQHVQDTNQSLRAGLDTIFGQVNHLMRGVIEREVENHGLADTMSSVIGDMGTSSGGNGKIAAINIEGYAQINDESLRVLDINGKFEFNLPDSLKVQAHLRIMEIDANTPKSGCRNTAGQTAATVEVDARAECDWIGAEGSMVEVGARFALINGSPVGFDGYFAFSGEVSVGPVTVKEMRLVAGFGTTADPGDPKVWAYIGGKARGLYGGYESAVGVFLGRTCDVRVLRMIDPTVDLALAESRVNTAEPITGVYFYGESWFPLNEVFGIPSSCLLTLKGGAGSGFFAFIGKRDGLPDDAVFVGCKQLYGVEGTVLCALKARGTMTIFGAVALNIPALPLIGASPEEGLFGMADSLTGGTYIIRGEGTFDLQFGWCPVCVELSRSIGLTWTLSPPKASLGISF